MKLFGSACWCELDFVTAGVNAEGAVRWQRRGLGMSPSLTSFVKLHFTCPARTNLSDTGLWKGPQNLRLVRSKPSYKLLLKQRDFTEDRGGVFCCCGGFFCWLVGWLGWVFLVVFFVCLFLLTGRMPKKVITGNHLF